MKVEVMKIQCPKCGADAKQNKYHHIDKTEVTSSVINCTDCGVFDMRKEKQA